MKVVQFTLSSSGNLSLPSSHSKQENGGVCPHKGLIPDCMVCVIIAEGAEVEAAVRILMGREERTLVVGQTGRTQVGAGL